MSVKGKKRILRLFLGLILLLPCIMWFVTDFFIDYALMRTDSSTTLANTMKKSSNRKKLSSTQQQVQVWLEEITTEPVETTSFDGLNLWAMSYVQETPSDLWLIAVHGYQSSYSSLEDIAMECHSRGYHVLLPDLRGHGNSQGEYIGMGYHDSLDILTWVNVIVAENPNAQIALYGLSMGGATVMMAAGQEGLAENVYAVVEDCGYSDAYTMISQQLGNIFHLPAFPLLPITNFYAQFRTNYDLRDASPIEFLESATVPMLFIHGAEDKYVLVEMQEDLYESYQGEKAILTVEGAAHTSSRRVAYDSYYSTIFSFLEQYQLV